ncbi:hypothetical protein EBZ38_09590 [bacterium]|nr:hypothetical protein [bacterium]
MLTGENNVTTIPAAYQGQVRVGWLKRRAWFAVPLGAATSNSAVFVYDPLLGQQGGWTKYDLALGPMLEWRQTAATTLQLGCQTGSNKRVLKLEQTTGSQDDFGSGATNFSSYYTTHWETAGSAVQKKRWRRPEFVIDADIDVSLTVKAWKNFDPTQLSRQFTVSATAPVGTTTWGGSTWGGGYWSSSGTGASDPTTANQAARKAYVDSAVPIGSLMSYIGSTAPNSSWALCNGSAISRTTYSTLFAVIGTTYGAGDGATTFNVPDLRGRVPVGFGQGTGLTNRTMAASGGSEALASHNHSTLDTGYGSTVFTTASSTLSIVETAKAVANSWSYQQVSFNGAAVTGSTGAGSSGNMQPFVVVNFIIKVA